MKNLFFFKHILNHKYIRNLIKCFMFFLVFLGVTSCQKVIQINLNAASPQIVIEGNISDQPGPYTVSLSQTINFSEVTGFPPVTGANVTIKDYSGNTETLTETSPGKYVTSVLQGIPGRTYTLTVIANSKTYTATSTMANPVNIDSLVYLSSGFDGDKTWMARVLDPPGIVNYYAIFVAVNNVVQSNFSTADDKLRDGDTLDLRIPIPHDIILTPGDSVQVILESIDSGVREYFRLLRLLDRQGGIQSAPPANPITNLSAGALGYFSAHADRKKILVIP